MIKVLHIVGGSHKNGAFKGAYILHKALIDLGIDSRILSDQVQKPIKSDTRIININNNFIKQLISKCNTLIEKVIKSIFLPVL